ncbi:myosin heavy fast skeletal muscle [Paramuricea clavata]|uniref:Myosin heavy fast skeletal muscle n=1 Tax=Paramuricea clavata TaxID=317549 RepID=A0A7D9JMN3_PARCT|nr:myosin heavy fast skeletal muscle [Paramuricea clavata]
MTNNVTGYGPSNSRLIFDGDERRYELWEVKFLGYLRLKKLSETILTPLADDASQEVIAADSIKNMDAFAELIQFLDDRSLSLVIRDAANDGRKALGILREHYLSKGKPRVISLYTELTSLKKSADEDITDYMLRAETSATSLKSAGEQVSDSLLIAMIIKGLPSAEYKPFSTVVTQKDKELSFSEFKVSLRSFEETQKLSTECAKEDSVMKVNTGKPSYKSKKDLICYGCGKAGHKKSECRVKKRWCDTCKNHTHDTEKCRKKKQEDDATKAFSPEHHYIELADGSRSNNVALKRGDANVELCDVDGNVQKALLRNALYMSPLTNRTYSLFGLQLVEVPRQQGKSKSLKDWHEILGHCNLSNVLALENVVDGMKITGIVMIYFIRHKSDTLKATETFLADSSPYGKIKCIRSDNGTEFTSEAFENLLIKHCIKHEKSAPYSPHQNGTVERVWRSIFDMAKCLLIEAKLPKTLWTYAVMAAVYIRNRCYNHRLKKTPYEVFTSQKPNLQNMHVFGTVCYTYVQEKKKLDPRGEEGIFVGYDKGSPAYLIYFPETGSIKRIRCVRFTDKFVNDKNTEESPQLNIEDEMIVSLPSCPSDPQPTNENENHVVPPNPVSDLNNDIGDPLMIRVGMSNYQKLGTLVVTGQSQSI